VFDGVLADVERRRKRLTVYAPTETDLASRFATRNVVVEHVPVPSGSPGPFVAVHDDDAFRGAVGLDTLETLLAPPVVRPGDLDDLSSAYRALFEVLDDAVFGALTRRQLLATSREIEDRAFRVGEGTLRASFQSLSVFESQAAVYRTLAGETDLEVHVYGRPNWTPAAVEGVTFHGHEAVAPYWALAFDGGGVGESCALLARERDDRFEGFWTYDPDLVTRILAEFEALEA
jgi:hypothetical protein